MAPDRRGCESADMSESVITHRTARTITGTTATTSADTQNMNHHRPAMRCAPGPSGCSVEGEVSPHALAPRANRRVPADLTHLCLDRERTAFLTLTQSTEARIGMLWVISLHCKRALKRFLPSVCGRLLTCRP